MKIQHKKSLILLLFATLFFFVFTYLQGENVFEQKAYNFMVKTTTKNAQPSSEIVLVVIDDKSLIKHGRWPWKRTKYVEIFDYLTKYTNAKQIAYDAIIVAPDVDNPKSDEEFFNKVKEYKNLTVGFGFSFEDFSEVVDKNSYETLLKEKNKINFIDKRSKKNKKQSSYKSFSALQKTYFKNVNSLGAANTDLDIDDYSRDIAQITDYKGNLYPSLGLTVYSELTGIKDFTLTDKFIVGKNENYSLKIPIFNDQGGANSLTYFYKTKDGVYSHEKISASDIIDSFRAIKKGEKPILDEKIFENKIVYVGANANAQALQDLQRTPISDSFSGLDIQATNFDNILHNEFYTKLPKALNLLTVFALFALSFGAVCIFSMPIAISTCLCLSILYFLLAFFAYSNKFAIYVLLPEISILFAIGCAYYYKYIIEDKKKEEMRSIIGKYLSYDVMKDVVSNAESVKLGGKRANVTVLFADIRGFTSISEKLSAEEVTKILNEYFSAIIPIIKKNDGVLNKFVGDAVLAIFGEPIKNEKHPLNAVKCAIEMLDEVKSLQEKWLEEGKPKIEIGIGIATGEVFVGNVGSEERLEYTVIGDTVNTASRIENFNKIYHTKLLISQETFETVQRFVDVIKIKEVTIRGKAKKVNIYEVLRLLDK